MRACAVRACVVRRGLVCVCACMCTLRFQNAEITLRFQILDLSEAVALPTGVQTGGQRLARRRKRAHKYTQIYSPESTFANYFCETLNCKNAKNKTNLEDSQTHAARGTARLCLPLHRPPKQASRPILISQEEGPPYLSHLDFLVHF